MRADFSYDIMQKLGNLLQSAVDGDDEVSNLKSKAKVDVSASGTLQAIDIKVSVLPKPDTDLSKDELDEIRKKISDKINAVVKGSIKQVLQESINRARARV